MVGDLTIKKTRYKKAKPPPPRRGPTFSRQKRPPPIHPASAAALLLEQFSTADLASWRERSSELDEYFTRVFYELAWQRTLARAQLSEALQTVRPTLLPLTSWVRIVDYKFTLSPLSRKGSITDCGGRFNLGADLHHHGQPFPALYIAQNADTAYAETFGLSRGTVTEGLEPTELALRRPTSMTTVYLNGLINGVFHLTKKNLRAFTDIISTFRVTDSLHRLADKLKIAHMNPITTPDLLFESLLSLHWRGWPVQHSIPANSQIFGTMVKDAGFEAILYPSTRQSGNCLAVFPESFDKGDSFIEIAGHYPEEIHCRRIDSANCLLPD